jgi:hypothetical protein
MSPRARSLVGLVLLLILIFRGIALLQAGVYGWTIFILFPLGVGALATWVHRPPMGARAAGLGAIAVSAATCSLLLLGLEGLLCIVMCLPLAMPLGALGGWLAYNARSSNLTAQRGMTVLILLPAATLTWDTKVPPAEFEVRTAIVVAASPEEVWKHVVTISDMPKPSEWFFRNRASLPQAGADR